MFELLQVLLREAPRAISKAELHRRLWPDSHVADSTLTSLVGEVREALGETGQRSGIIRTLHRFGYACTIRPTVARSEPAAPIGVPVDDGMGAAGTAAASGSAAPSPREVVGEPATAAGADASDSK